MSVFRSVLITIVVLGTVSPAAAQIYSWRDVDGKLVVSDTPRAGGGAQTTYEVHGATSILTTMPFAASHKSAPYDATINLHARRQGVAEDLVRAVIQVESAFNPNAVSNKGAMGLMQLMPATAAHYGVADPFNPEENIRAGVAYLKTLVDRFDGSTELALAAYNAGPGAVEKYGRTIPPYRETQAYVRKIVSVTEMKLGPSRRIYKIVELIDGREVPRYSDKKPEGTYEVVTSR